MKNAERTHKYRITPDQAEKAWEILSSSKPMVKRLEDLLTITTGKRGTTLIGRGFRNDIDQILKVARENN
jgi:hypothetical protein